MKAMILAAGRGKRMGAITDTIPKPLLKIKNYCIIEHLLFALAKAGFQDIVINVAYLAKQIMTTLGDGSHYGVSIHYSFELEVGGLETGGGVFQALPLLGDAPFLVVSGDIVTDFPFENLPQQIKGLAHLVLVDNFPGHDEGDFCLKGGSISEQGETRLTYGNIGVYHPHLFLNCERGCFPLRKLLREAIALQKVTGEYYKGEWCNIGTPEQLRQCE